MTTTAQSPNTQNAVHDLASILAADQVISAEQLQEIRVRQANTGQEVKAVIINGNMAPPEAVVKAEGKLRNVPYVDLAETAVAPEALGMIPRSVAERYKLIPFSYNRATNELGVAMVDPLDLEAIDFVEQKSKTRVKPFIAYEEKLMAAITVSYKQSLTAEVKAALKDTAPVEKSKAVDIARLGEVIREAPIAKIVSTILEFAIKSRSSDIHIEPEEEKTRVRYRIDGILHEKLVLPRAVHDGVVSRIKILADLKIDEKRIPQDGRFTFKVNGQEVDLRVSSLPTNHGEKVVMRLLRKGAGVPDLPELGLRGTALKILEISILRPHGMILVTGPTGSGKTTTLYSALSRINTPKVNIMTLEDPVEYEIAGVSQVQVNQAVELTFASGLRSFVRQDPDVIMVGEIRDSETADLAVQAALTGHLVFSTLHTNDASGAVPRMLDLGAEPFLLASAINTVVGQRVCRRICEACKEEYDPPPEVAEDMKQVLGNLLADGPIKLARGRGCEQCNNTGYLGRVGIFEVLAVSERVGRLILERAPAGEIEKQALAEGMVTMKQDGYLKVLEKITSIEEVLRVAQDER